MRLVAFFVAALVFAVAARAEVVAQSGGSTTVQVGPVPLTISLPTTAVNVGVVPLVISAPQFTVSVGTTPLTISAPPTTVKLGDLPLTITRGKP